MVTSTYQYWIYSHTSCMQTRPAHLRSSPCNSSTTCWGSSARPWMSCPRIDRRWWALWTRTHTWLRLCVSRQLHHRNSQSTIFRLHHTGFAHKLCRRYKNWRSSLRNIFRLRVLSHDYNRAYSRSSDERELEESDRNRGRLRGQNVPRVQDFWGKVHQQLPHDHWG